MGAGGDLVMSEGGDAVLVLGSVVRLEGPLIRDAGVLQSLSGMFLPGQVLLLSPMFSRAAMCMRSRFVKLGSRLVIFPMGSVVKSLRHGYRLSICPDFVWASWASL